MAPCGKCFTVDGFWERHLSIISWYVMAFDVHDIDIPIFVENFFENVLDVIDGLRFCSIYVPLHNVLLFKVA